MNAISDLPSVHRLHVCNTDIRQDAEGRYCLNDLHKAAGNGNGERPSMWLKNKQTKALVDELENGAGIPALTSQARGSKQGSYVCKELVYAYAMWISPAFNLKVIRAFDALVTGQQASPQFHIPQTMGEALRLAADLSEQNAKMAERIEEDRPKVEFCEAVSASEQTMTVAEAAQILGTGEKRLFSLLREKEYIRKNGTAPRQSYVNRGLFDMKLSDYRTPNGFLQTRIQTLITGKGLLYLQKKYFHPQGVQLPLRFNPHPPGSIKPGSVAAKVIWLLSKESGRCFSEAEICEQLGLDRGSVSFVLNKQRFYGRIDSIPSPANARYFRWRIRNQAMANH